MAEMPIGFIVGAPNEGRNTSADILINQTHEPLFYYDSNLNLIPVLVRSWNISKNSKECIFFLKEGVLFHNGKEMTADDVIYSLKYASGFYSQNNNFFDQIDKKNILEKCGKYCFRIKSERIGSQLANLLAGANYKIVPYGSIRRGESPPGTGPFKIEGWEDGKITLVRFESYHIKNGVGNINKCIFVFLAKDSAIQEYKRGNVDDLFEYVLDDNTLSTLNGKKIVMPMYSFAYIGMNIRMHPFDRREIRLAMQHAVDRDALYNKHFPEHLPINGIIPRGMIGSTETGPYFSYNLRNAKKLLRTKIAGVEFWIRDKDWNEDFVADLKSQLSIVGININVRHVNSKDFFDSYFSRKQQMFFIVMGADYKDPESILSSFRSDSLDNDVGIKDKIVDMKIGKLAGTFNRDERAKEVKNITELIMDHAAIVPIYQKVAHTLYNDNIKNVNLSSSWHEDIRINDYVKYY